MWQLEDAAKAAARMQAEMDGLRSANAELNRALEQVASLGLGHSLRPTF